MITRCFLEKLNWIYHNGTINPEGIERDMERRVYTSTRNDAKTTFDMKRAALQQCVAMLTEDNGEQPLPREPEDTAVLLYMCGSLGATVVRLALLTSCGKRVNHSTHSDLMLCFPEMPKRAATYKS